MTKAELMNVIELTKEEKCVKEILAHEEICLAYKNKNDFKYIIVNEKDYGERIKKNLLIRLSEIAEELKALGVDE